MAFAEQSHNITLVPSKGPIILIDTSYYVFYRYYATYNWYRKQNIGSETMLVENIMKDDIFVDKYTKMFEKHILDVCKMHEGVHNNVVFATDCCRDSIWRHRFFDSYKATREEKSKNFNKEVFIYTYQKLLPQLIEKYGFQTIGNKSLEADDVIAIITDRLLNLSLEQSHTFHVVILTNDNDYIQLLQHTALQNAGDRVRLDIKNMQEKSLHERLPCPVQIYLEVKKILGDKSDNIPAIAPKCGEKTALKLAQNKSLLNRLFQSSPKAKEQYELNTLLIDFACIPADLKEQVIDKVHVC
jgi:5'-3' exonuclease